MPYSLWFVPQKRIATSLQDVRALNLAERIDVIPLRRPVRRVSVAFERITALAALFLVVNLGHSVPPRPLAPVPPSARVRGRVNYHNVPVVADGPVPFASKSRHVVFAPDVSHGSPDE